MLKGCSLRPIVKDDLPRLLSWRNSNRIHSLLFTDHRITLQEHRAWFKRISKDTDSRYFMFEIHHSPIGHVFFGELSNSHHHCSWGIYMGEEGCPKGAGPMMAYLGLQWAFTTWGVHKVYGEVLDINAHSIDFHKTMGFKQEGILRQHVFKNSRYHDVVLFALLRQDWEKIRSKFHP